MGGWESALEDVVMAVASREDYIDVAETIERFLDGTGGDRDWDDFILGRRFRDLYLKEVQLQCDGMSRNHPAVKPGHYCNEDGLALLRSIATEVRSRAAERPDRRAR